MYVVTQTVRERRQAISTGIIWEPQPWDHTRSPYRLIAPYLYGLIAHRPGPNSLGGPHLLINLVLSMRRSNAEMMAALCVSFWSDSTAKRGTKTPGVSCCRRPLLWLTSGRSPRRTRKNQKSTKKKEFNYLGRPHISGVKSPQCSEGDLTLAPPPDKSARTTVNAEQRVLAGTSRPDMTRDLGTVQQQQEKQMPGAEAAVGLEGGGIDGADTRQQNSEFRVGMRLHSRGCRWPDNTTSSEMRTWSEGFWVSLVVAFGAPYIGRLAGRGGASFFCVSSSLCLWFDRASERGSAMHALLLHFRLDLLTKMPEFRRADLHDVQQCSF